MDNLEGLIQAWKNAREQETSHSPPGNAVRYVEAPSTTAKDSEPEAKSAPVIVDPMPTIMPMLFTANLTKICPPSVLPPPPQPPAPEQSVERSEAKNPQAEITPRDAPPIVKVEEAQPEPSVTTEMNREVDVQQTATIVRVANRQRSDAGSSSLEKAKKKREKQQILLYGRFYKCKLQVKDLQRDILVACEKHNELLSQLSTLAKRANIPSDEMAVDSSQVTKRIQMIHSACIKQEPKVRRLRTTHQDAAASKP